MTRWGNGSRPLLAPALLKPPGVEAKGVRARHSTRAGDQSEICAQITAALPKRSRMEIPPVRLDQPAEIDVHRTSHAIPHGNPVRLNALDVPERVADVLNVEVHASLFQTAARPNPIAEKMSAIRES